jgi:hypothetical protein
MVVRLPGEGGGRGPRGLANTDRTQGEVFRDELRKGTIGFCQGCGGLEPATRTAVAMVAYGGRHSCYACQPSALLMLQSSQVQYVIVQHRLNQLSAPC